MSAPTLPESRATGNTLLVTGRPGARIAAGLALICLLASSSSAAQAVQATDPVAVPKSKQTTLGLYLTAREAYDRWKAAPQDVMIIDVRTPEEFIFVGHPGMAWLIPFATQTYRWDAARRMYAMEPLPDFVARVQQVATPASTLLVTCRSGERGAMAVNALARAGFTNVYNITDGVEGDVVRDSASVFLGKRLMNGWKNSAPWTYEIDPARVVLPQ